MKWPSEYNFNSQAPDYVVWKARIFSALRAAGCDGVARGTATIPAEDDAAGTEAYNNMDYLAHHILQNSLDAHTMHMVSELEHSWEILEYMEKKYNKKNRASVATAWEEFMELKYQAGADMVAYISDYELRANALVKLGKKMAEEDRGTLFLISLGDAWRELRTRCLNCETPMEWSDIQGEVLSEYRMRTKAKASGNPVTISLENGGQESVNYVSSTSGYRHQAWPQQQQMPTQQEPWKQRQKRRFGDAQGNGEKKCYGCGKLGHIRRDCKRQRGSQQQGEALVATSSGPPSGDRQVTSLASASAPTMWQLVVTDDANAAVGGKRCAEEMASMTQWIVDSGCTSHVCNDKSAFVSLTASHGKSVRVGNSATLAIAGAGEVQLNARGAEGAMVQLVLTECLYVPDMAMNLLSVRKLRAKGVLVDFNSFVDRVVLRYGDRLVHSVVKPDTDLYVIDTEPSTVINPAAFAVSSAPTKALVHRRLGHLSDANIDRLGKLNQATDNPSLKIVSGGDGSLCDVCERANTNRASFKNTVTFPPQKVNDICSTDLKGPIEVPSLGGHRYVMVIVDGFTGYTCASLLKSKAEALDRFVEYVRFTETKHGRKVRQVNSDGEGEFQSAAWVSFCREEGIERRLTTTNTPEQNGTAEVRFRLLFRKVRALLLDAQLPKLFWGDAFLVAVLLANISPSRSRGGIPYDLWHGHPADYSRLRVFGCLAYAHVDTRPRKQDEMIEGKLRKTLDNRGVRGIFIGYSNNKKAWRILLGHTGTVVETAHASFDESFSYAMTELQHHALDGLRQRLGLTFVYPSRQTSSATIQADFISLDQIPTDADLTPPLAASTSNDVDVAALDSFLHEFNLEEFRGNDPVGPSALLVDQVQQALTKTGDLSVLSAKQKQAEALVHLENLSHKDECHSVAQLRSSRVPRSYKEALASTNSEDWMKAISEEGSALFENKTWTLTDLPPGKMALTCQWLFKEKVDANGVVVRLKARLVVRGNEQVKYIDFEDIFAPVIRLESLRVLLALVAVYDLECEQVDVDTAFLNGVVDEEIYMRQPEGLTVAGKEHLVCRLIKSLYGLKQAPRAWYRRLTQFLKSHGFQQLDAEACVYVLNSGNGDLLIVGIYVDDLLLIAKGQGQVAWIKELLKAEFKIKDLGPVSYILGMEVIRDRKERTLSINQATYARSVLEKYNLGRCNKKDTPVDPNDSISLSDCPQDEQTRARMKDCDYRGLVGSLMYLMTGSRPDIAFAISRVSKFLQDPGPKHLAFAKHVLRYIAGTVDYGLVYKGSVEGARQLVCFTDSDYAKDQDNRRSVSSYVCVLGGAAVTYSSKSQRTVALSTTESEYMALAHGAKEVLFLRQLLKELHCSQPTTTVRTDNQSAIALAENPVHHQRSKHIDVRYHFVRERLESKDVKIEHVESKLNVADLLTKNVTRETVERLRPMLGVLPIDRSTLA